EFTKTAAEEFLNNEGIKPRQLVRNLIEQHDGRYWNLTRRGTSIILSSVTQIAAANRQDFPSSVLTGIPEDANLAISSSSTRRDAEPVACRTGLSSVLGPFSPLDSIDTDQERL